ncbi:MAG TPA: ATP-binding cassette domain-containing protein [Smithella sp.]|jgi:oligopeptide/dipeptide ABC transporter ATP-binding protein|nr:ATP-binding cassette domain-containing protein [Smithella sp.]NMC96234.1 ATP-binding cassette domain-containing protein [Deltaproteobacteria bacterium]OQC54794.1 MAG: Oligopeptide transport ATP-binding protein OppF [Deltaproteobacteria bacterium ADurb.Bin022]HOC60831.1 ATP-binding cassette domain-containing protein [Smithellaceae bacterium]HNQ65545.1 ATP-binding cassette domain-containing protein [Smithella sp.]
MSSVLVDIQKVDKKYTLGGNVFGAQKRIIHAVKNVDLQIIRGETLGLVGESGCGKSTLARLITRLENPTSGVIAYKGENIFTFTGESLKTYRRSVQIIFQDTYSSLNPRKSALSMIREPLTIHRLGSKKEREETALSIMAKVGLKKEQAHRYPHEFSGGQRQRIGIARALVLNPELIIADEPVSSLDVSIQAQILNLLRDLKNDFHLTYLFVSHDLNVIRYISDRVAVMYLGKIVELAGGEDIYNRPLHPYTRMLLSAVPSCDPGKRKTSIAIKGEARETDNEGCAFRNRCPYRIDVCDKTDPALDAINGQSFCACHRAGAI